MGIDETSVEERVTRDERTIHTHLQENLIETLRFVELNNTAEMNIRSTGNKEKEILISFYIDIFRDKEINILSIILIV